MAVGGAAAAGSVVDDPTVSAGSEAEALPASAREVLGAGAPAWLCICQKQPAFVLCSIGGSQRVFLSVMAARDFLFQHNVK